MIIYNSPHPIASLLIAITSSGNNIVGEMYNLTCTAVISGSPDIPIISWNSTETDETVSYDNGTYSKLLRFDPLKVTHDNVYMCQVKVADIIEEQLFNLTVQSKYTFQTNGINDHLCLFFNSIAPLVSVQINDGGATPVAGEKYTLTCRVSGAESLNPTITYQWTKNNDTVTHTNSKTLLFSTLRVSDAGDYVCKVNVSSGYLIQPIDASSIPFSAEFQSKFVF